MMEGALVENGYHVLARIVAQPECDEELAAALLQLANHSLGTEHCERFEVTQQLNRPGVFWLIESFPSPVAYERHVEMAHTQRFLDETLPTLIAERCTLVLRDHDRT